jgi:hypothetical protein
MLVGHIDGLHSRKNRLNLIPSFAYPANDLMFGFDGFGGGELTSRLAMRTLDNLKLP